MDSYKCCSPNTDEFTQVESVSSLLKVVGNESRLKLLCLLRQGEHCVCELLEHVDMSQSLVSHHLSDLKAAGLTHMSKRGRKVFYALTPKGSRITNTIFSL